MSNNTSSCIYKAVCTYLKSKDSRYMVSFKNNVLPLTDQIIISKITCANVKLVILINIKESSIKGYATSPYTTTLTKIEFKEYNKEKLIKDAIKAIESASYTLFDEDEEQAKDFDRMY